MSRRRASRAPSCRAAPVSIVCGCSRLRERRSPEIPYAFPIRLVQDSAPSVEIPVPGADTLAPLSLLVPLIIDARDDHSITSVTLESRRISRFGVVDATRRDTVAVPAERPDRAILNFTLDLNRRGLLPGDTVRYSAVARDNTPRGQLGRSREFVLRLPTMSEVRAAQREATDAVASQLDSITQASRRVERQTDDLARERSRPTDARAARTVNRSRTRKRSVPKAPPSRRRS